MELLHSLGYRLATSNHIGSAAARRFRGLMFRIKIDGLHSFALAHRISFHDGMAPFVELRLQADRPSGA